jgi:hypothetical protein
MTDGRGARPLTRPLAAASSGSVTGFPIAPGVVGTGVSVVSGLNPTGTPVVPGPGSAGALPVSVAAWTGAEAD